MKNAFLARDYGVTTQRRAAISGNRSKRPENTGLDDVTEWCRMNILQYF